MMSSINIWKGCNNISVITTDTIKNDGTNNRRKTYLRWLQTLLCYITCNYFIE